MVGDRDGHYPGSRIYLDPGNKSWTKPGSVPYCLIAKETKKVKADEKPQYNLGFVYLLSSGLGHDRLSLPAPSCSSAMADCPP